VGKADDWLKGLVRAVWKEAVPPKDARVKSLWDLLRQRQALRDSGADPNRAATRSESTVEGYLG